MSTEYTIRRKVLTLFGAKFHIYNAQGELAGFSQQKAFKLKEDIRIYADESKSRELMRIAARSIIDWGAAYDVIDSATNAKVGALRRKGWSSMVRDSWSVLGPADQELGQIQEDSVTLALARRLLPFANLIPQSYSLRQGAADSGPAIAEYHTHFNPFIHKLTVIIPDECPLSPYLVLAGGILLAAVEGRQQD